MDLAKLIGVILGVVLIVGPVIKWLVSDWFKKSKQIQELRAKASKEQIDTIRESLRDVRATIRHLQSEIKTHTTQMNASSKQIVHLNEKIVESVARIDGVAKNVESSVQRAVKSEIIQLTKNLTLIREKKNGKA